MQALRATVTGTVQGVGYRDFVLHKARPLSLTGYVRNLPDGRSVEVVAEGDRADLDRLVEQLKKGPSAAHVQNVDCAWSPATGRYTSFEITW